MPDESGRAHTCGLCRDRVPALTDQGICERCADRLFGAGIRVTRRRKQERRFERTVPKQARKR